MTNTNNRRISCSISWDPEVWDALKRRSKALGTNQSELCNKIVRAVLFRENFESAYVRMQIKEHIAELNALTEQLKRVDPDHGQLNIQWLEPASKDGLPDIKGDGNLAAWTENEHDTTKTGD